MRRAERRAVHQAQLDAMALLEQADLQLQIRRLLALPMNQRTHFLRVKVAPGRTAL